MRRVWVLTMVGLLLATAPMVAAQSEAPTPAPESSPEPPAFNANPFGLTGSEAVTFLRFVHAAPDALAVDLYVQELGEMPLAEAIHFGQEVGYFFLAAGNYTVIAREAGSGIHSEVLASTAWSFQQNTSWLVAFAGLAANFSLQLEPINLLRDDIGPDQARVRLVNLIAGGPVVTVRSAASDDFGTNFGWIGVVDRETTPGRVLLSVTAQDNSVLLADTEVELPGAALTTLLLVGDARDEPSIDIVAFSSPAAVSRVQFVNDYGAPLQIFLRPGNVELIAVLEPGATSDWMTVDSGAVTFVAYAPGTGPRGQELAAWIGTVHPVRDLVITFRADRSADEGAPAFSPQVTPTPAG